MPIMATKANTVTAVKPPRSAPVLAAVRNDIPMPDRKISRGSKSIYPFESLQVGQSFGIIGKAAKSMSSIISNQCKKEYRAMDGSNPRFHTVEMNGTTVPTEKPLMYRKVFTVADVNPKTDPDKASARVWRLPDEIVEPKEAAPAAAAPANPAPATAPTAPAAAAS
jgi:hypothetical protein